MDGELREKEKKGSHAEPGIYLETDRERENLFTWRSMGVCHRVGRGGSWWVVVWVSYL